MNKCLLIFISVALTTAHASRAEGQLIIANANVKAAKVSKGEIKDVFTGASSDLGGAHVAPVLLKSGPANDDFLAFYIGKSGAAFIASWRTLVFSGQATMPRSFDSEGALVEFVAKTPGAMGYISKATLHQGVKVLAER